MKYNRIEFNTWNCCFKFGSGNQETSKQPPRPKNICKLKDTTLDLKQEVCAYSTALERHFPTLLVVFFFSMLYCEISQFRNSCSLLLLLHLFLLFFLFSSSSFFANNNFNCLCLQIIRCTNTQSHALHSLLRSALWNYTLTL